MVAAADVGSFRDDVLEGETGFLCRPNDSDDLAKTVEKYFASELFGELDSRRKNTQECVKARHS